MTPLVTDVFGLERLRTNDRDDPIHALDRILDLLQEGATTTLHGLAVPPHANAGFGQVTLQSLNECLVIRPRVGDEYTRTRLLFRHRAYPRLQTPVGISGLQLGRHFPKLSPAPVSARRRRLEFAMLLAVGSRKDIYRHLDLMAAGAG